jgi:hypothetical protein
MVAMLALLLAFGSMVVGCDNGTTDDNGDNFVPVTNITNIPQIALVGTALELGGIVVPSNATNQTITWSGTNVTNGVFEAISEGDYTVTVTIVNGASKSSPYTKIFPIKVYNSSTAAIASVQGNWTKLSTAGFPPTSTDTMTVTGSAFVMKNDSIDNMIYAAGIIIGLNSTDYMVQLNATLGQDGQLHPDFFYEEGTYNLTGNTVILTTDASYNGVSPAKGTWTKVTP